MISSDEFIASSGGRLACPRTAASRPANLTRAALLAALILFGISHPATGQTGDTYDRQLDNKFTDTQRPDENQLTPEQIKALDLQRTIQAEAQRMAHPAPSTSESQSRISANSAVTAAIEIPLGMALFIVAAFVLVKRKLDTMILKAEAALNRVNVLETDPSLEGFFTELRDGLGAHTKAEEASVAAQSAASLQSLLDSLPHRFGDLRSLVSQIPHTAEITARKQLLTSLYQHVGSLREQSRIPALQPAWLLAGGVEGLLKQLLHENSELNPSAQRSVAAAIDLLALLCAKGVNPDLASEPPIRILAVDDDPVSRCAISFALKKAFDVPTLASGGEEALGFATKQSYDIIFLDVEMPGMDGFELCTKIRETSFNKTTPIVFVTRHSDFNSRAKSNLSGGQDLIGKPYLSFEITVKALTLVLRNRLQPGAVVPRTIESAAPGSAGVSPASAAPPQAPDLQKPYTTTVPSTYSSSTADPESEPESERPTPSTSFLMRPKDPADPISHWAPVYMENLRNQLHAAAHCTKEEDLQELLTGTLLGIHSFGVEVERAELRTIQQVSAVLEQLLKKLTLNPRFCTPSTLDAAAAALELLAELSSHEDGGPDLANPPPRILVVDDDPLARRAVSGAIQLVFGKPDTADSGEAAIAMAAEKPFDLIFLDVVMPGIDGFAACKKIHHAFPNSKTPVVFVTSHDDTGNRAQASAAGGSGFLPKPVLSSQLTLLALTFIARSRLDKIEPNLSKDSKPSLAAAL